jgi:hypothetical protein
MAAATIVTLVLPPQNVPVDDSSCFELDCCPPGYNVRDILTSEAILTENDVALLTEDDNVLLS